MTTPRLIQRVSSRIGYATNPAGGTHDAGFTLIEAVVSFVLFAIVATASVAVITDTTKSSNDTRNRVTAANLAQQDLQQARAVSDRTAVTSRAPKSATVGSKTFTVKRTVSGTCPAVSTVDGVTRIDVTTTVTWPGSSATGVTMATRLAC